MPIHDSHRPGYFYALHRRHRDTYNPDSHGPRSGASGVLTMMEHSGTHIDALCHQACGMEMFGGVKTDQAETPAGFNQLGIEQVPPIFTRGVMLDVAKHQNIPRLPEHHSITEQELKDCASAQKSEIHSGDVLIVRTGSGAIWDQPEPYLRAAGVHRSGSKWAASLGVVAVGADNMAWDPLNGEKDPETGATLFGHVHLLVRNGIYIIENLYLEQLSQEQCYEFTIVVTPLKLNGATGSPVRPLALV